jgi:AcrR family transcriptional regulator
MTTTPAARPLRVDAQRNHDRIIGAATRAFAELGLEVPMEEIARRAGVGPATLYRRFANKEQLLQAIYDARIGELEATIGAACAEADPWDGLLSGMRALLEAQARNIAFVQMLDRAGELTALKRQLKSRVFAPLLEAFVRAQAAGQLRGDLRPEELPALIGMVAATIPCDAGWPRYLALLTDALRASDRAPLPPPAIDPGEAA